MNHLFLLFSSYSNMKELKFYENHDKRTNKVYTSIVFNTYALPCFNYYYYLFYQDKVKIIPKNIMDLLTDKGLAYWIMDDGTFSKRDDVVTLCTDSYLESDVENLILVLSKKFELDCYKVKKNNNFRIVIKNSSLDKLRELVLPHFHKSMFYKLGL